MRLESLTIQNFRSITNAYKLRLSSSTVLIGPNNEGKSNVLRALVLGTRELIGRRPRLLSSPFARRLSREEQYRWDRDFPLHLQKKKPNGGSVFVLEYALTDSEVDEFRAVTGSNLNGTLPLKVVLAHSGSQVTVYKKGPGGAALSAKADKVLDFVTQRIDLEYIPAVRTAESAEAVVNDMVARALSGLEDKPEYLEAIQRIADIQDPILKELSESIKETLVQFLPAVVSVQVRGPTERRFEALRNCEILVDDGSLTELRYKGDGVQSLAALGMMRHASAKSILGKNVVVAIEEPESHLHPKAIHELRAVIEQLAAKHQVVVTTHCPLFVARSDVKSNIIVNNGKAKPAKSLAEIRDILGVRAADNLLHADLVLVVEGEDDSLALSSLLKHYSSIISDALSKDRLTFDTLGGASNLAYKLGLIRDAFCDYHVFLDADNAGIAAHKNAQDAGLLKDADATMTICPSLREAEFEDLLSEDFVDKILLTAYGIRSSALPKNMRSNKWSGRMQSVFNANGKLWSKTILMGLKLKVAQAVSHDPANALAATRRTIFDSLVSAIEAKLKPATAQL